MATTYTRIVENLVLTDTLVLDGPEWDNTLIRNVTIHDTGDGRDGITIRDVSNVRIENCEIYNTGHSGIRLAASGSSSNVQIVNNYIHDNDANGISSGENHQNLLISGNRIDNTGLAGGSNVPDHHGMYVQAKDFLIEGNYVTASDDGNGISVRTSGIIRDNLVDGSGKSGIAYYVDHPAGPSDTLVIEGNVVLDSAGYVSNRTDIELLGIPSGKDGMAVHNFVIRDNIATEAVDWHSDFNASGYSINTSNNKIVSDSEARSLITTRWNDQPDPTTEPEPTAPTTGEPSTGSTLAGTSGDDNLVGGTGDDTLNGDTGLDTLDGGAGNDVLTGGRDGDTFVIRAGEGNDTITDFYTQWADVIQLTDFGISSFSELQGKLSQDGNDTVVDLGDGQTLRLSGVTASSLTETEFAFDNSGVAADPAPEAPVESPAAPMVLDGTSGDDNLVGGTGDDTLNGDTGLDTLDGGAGNDVLTGGRDGDTFVIRAGEGNDTIADFYTQWADVIQLTDFGISSFSELQGKLSQDGNDTVVDLGDGQTLRLSGVTVSSLTETEFAFDNSGVVDDLVPETPAEPMVLDGTSGDDFIVGDTGNDALSGDTGLDILDGGAGDDVLTGGRDGDTFIIRAGEGNDTVTDFYHQWSDVIQLTDMGFSSFDELLPRLSQQGSDTVIDLPGDQTLTLQGVTATDLTASEFEFTNGESDLLWS